jgi:hypothetical protein
MNTEPANSQLPAIPARPSWEQRILELREEEWQAHRECLDAASECLKRYKAGPHRAVSLRDIARLLELASKLGRLATGADSAAATVGNYEDPQLIAELQRQLDQVFSEPIDIEGVPEPTPVFNTSSARLERL